MSYGEQVIDFSTADRLRKARQAAGLSQTELAHRIGISRSTVSRVEVGGPVRPIVLSAWAQATGVPLSWFQADALAS